MTETELRESARFMIDQVRNKTASLDGEILNSAIRLQSPLFDITLPNHNIFGVHEGKTRAISDGYWVFLRPLPLGVHHVEYNATASFSNGITVRKEGIYRLMVYPPEEASPVEKDSEEKIHFHPSRMIEATQAKIESRYYRFFYEVIESGDSNE